MTSMVLGTGNRGNHANEKSIREFLKGTDIVALTEMHSEDETRQALRNSRQYGIFEGRREDSEANPIVWRHETIKIEWRRTVPLLEAGKRDGKYNMAKSMNLVHAVHRESCEHFLFASVHQIQTVYTKERRPAAKQFVHRIDQRLNKRRLDDLPTFVGGDWNAVWTHDVMDELREEGWRADPQLKGDLSTFKNRDIDYFVYRNLKGQMKIRRKWTEPIGGSDHDGKKLRVQLL